MELKDLVKNTEEAICELKKFQKFAVSILPDNLYLGNIKKPYTHKIMTLDDIISIYENHNINLIVSSKFGNAYIPKTFMYAKYLSNDVFPILWINRNLTLKEIWNVLYEIPKEKNFGEDFVVTHIREMQREAKHIYLTEKINKGSKSCYMTYRIEKLLDKAINKNSDKNSFDKNIFHYFCDEI